MGDARVALCKNWGSCGQAGENVPVSKMLIICFGGMLSNSFPILLAIQSCLTLCNPMDFSPPVFSVQGILQALEVDCHSLLQGIFSTYGLNLGLLHCRQIVGRVWITREASLTPASILNMSFFSLCLRFPLLALKRTSIIGFRAHPKSRIICFEILNLITPAKILFPKVMIIGYWDLRRTSLSRRHNSVLYSNFQVLANRSQY